MSGPLIDPKFVTMVVNPRTLDTAMVVGDGAFDLSEECWNCEYVMAVHRLGDECPDEFTAAGRMGWN